IQEILDHRHRQYFESQGGLAYLARETGGLFTHDNNDLSEGVRRAVEDLSGYYLIGYKPAESSFALENGYRRFHKIQVKVKVGGLEVRSRAGYLGVPDEETRPVYHTRAEEIGAALFSPFRSNDLKLRLTCLFSEVPKTGAVVRSLLYIDAGGLTYTSDPDGSRKTVLDIVAVVFGESGMPVSSADRTLTVKLSDKAYAQAISSGFLSDTDVALKKPGAYQVRVAVRDVASDKIGSASQFLEVPDVRKHHLALSGIIVNSASAKTTEDGRIELQEDYAVGGSGSPALRVFRQGETISYRFLIFNAKRDAKTGRPDLETQVLLYRDSKPVYTGAVTPLKTDQHTDLTRVLAYGALRLGPDLEPGEYQLQLVAWDKLAPPKQRLATQWADLEVEE
ncbi:MAG TPA: hypothetical protein VLX58_08860, partial [Bryobacteraceae bacterium]|nr:hypothetical protein [Bryobacteraceae bacterium]